MFEDETKTTIENRMLDRIDRSKYDTRPGMILQTNFGAEAVEFAKIYEYMDYIIEQINPLTADREHLEGWGKTFSINPLQATYAILKATIIMKEGYECPIGSRFSQESLNFVVISKDGDTEFSIQCEEAGEIGNTAYGRIVPILNIPGLISATITGTSIPGTDIESDESLRERFTQNFQDKSYGWNMATYKQEIAKIQGVGGFKVIRYFEEKDWHVGVYLIDSTYHKASEELIELVQETLLPILPDYEEPTIQNSGDGEVAIGHVPIVMSASEVTINITLHLEFMPSYSYEQLEQTIKEKIENYLTNECNKNWDEQDYIIVRTSGIESAILDIQGIADIYDTEINGEKANLQLDSLEITKLGTVTNGGTTIRTVRTVRALQNERVQNRLN